MAKLRSWKMVAPGKPLQLVESEMPATAANQALVRIVGCGVCHTDIGFWAGGVQTKKALPLTLGHEISGVVEDASPPFQEMIGKAVIVPAVMPCGRCDLCKRGHGNICRRQVMPGNDVDGGFSSHVLVPAGDLCVVDVFDEPEKPAESGPTLTEMAVIADAVSTPYQAVLRSGLKKGELAVFVGVGGVGGFGVQIARAMGASVVAIDIDDRRLRLMETHGAEFTLNASQLKERELRTAVRDFVRVQGLQPYEWKIFETSGTAAGQTLAFNLLTYGATLSVVGFTLDPVQVRISNLMAYDARALGNWGCLPEHYPEVVEMVLRDEIQLSPFVQSFPMSKINDVLESLQRHELVRRPILVPDFS